MECSGFAETLWQAARLSSWPLVHGSSTRGEGQVELRSGYGGLGKALQKGSAMGRRPEHLQGML